MSERYDLVVIGGGSAGLTATTIAAKLGARVLLVDRAALGGDCLHDGCVPSKALIASARLAHQARRAREFGLAAGGVRVDARAVMDRVRRVQASIGEQLSVTTLRAAGAEVMLGGGRFLDPHTIEVGPERARVAGHRFLIATGSRARVPRIPGLEEAGFIDHRGVFKLESIPRRLAVIGGGPVGVELGQALARLGATVSIVTRGLQLLEREEPEVADHLRRALESEGLAVHLETSPTSVRREGEEKILERPGDAPIVVDEILVAVGRSPALQALDLPAAHVETSAKGIVVDEHLQTSQPHIFAAGDCTGGPQFTHFAELEARIATRNALFFGSERRSLEVVPWVTFTDPEVARVGRTEAEAQARHGSVHVFRFPFDHLDRALTEGEPGGFIKVIVDKKERVLGAHVIGHAAGEVIGEWVLALLHPETLRLPTINAAIHAYPTMSRVNRSVADVSFVEHGLPEWKVRLGARFRPRA